MSSALQYAVGTILVGGLVLGLKVLAWWLTGSVALLSDALESTVNLATAFAALIAIRLAARPADKNHPYGHHKAEYFSAGIEGVMIVFAAVLILREAALSLTGEATLVAAPATGMAVNGVATVINGVWCWVLIREGRRLRSPALVADGKHLWTDVFTSVGILAGLFLAIVTGWHFLDPLIAAIVAVHILWSGFTVIGQTMSGLMDEAVPAQTQARIETIIAAEAGGAVQAHDIKTRVAASAVFIEFHLVVAGDMTVFEAHEICDRVEAALRETVEGAEVTIHVEPEHKAEGTGAVVVH